MRLPARRTFPLLSLVLAASAGSSLLAAPNAGAGADYPMVLGDPFMVDGVTYVPADTLNYDRVGQAAAAAEGVGASGAHRTLPLPSYVEVTSLKTGRTILVRLDRRGPMTGNALIELSPAAAAQLGGMETGALAVRVRRVNPPEAERAVLRIGQTAPPRIETPPGLLAALNRKLEAQNAPAPAAAAPTAPPTAPDVAQPTLTPKPAALPASVALKPHPTVSLPAKPTGPTPAVAERGSFVVQLAAFSTAERARSAAAKVGGNVAQSGRFWRLRMGPYPDRGKAEAALAKARAAGYSDARIQRAN